jgi:hypothetical protein
MSILSRSLFAVGVVFVLAASAEAQPGDPACNQPGLHPYNQGGNPELLLRCTDHRPYVPVAPPGGCVQPYADASVLLCEPGAALAASRVELRPLLDYAMRSNIPQAALGQAGRELAYVNLHNLEDVEQAVVVEYAIQGRPGVIVQSYTLAPKTTRGVGLHAAADPLFAGRLDVSVTAYFTAAGTMNMKWLRAGDMVETASETGTVVPRVQ